ncbi:MULTISPECIES: glycosyltransferase [unclassified Streptomyces]|uniref:glycosyltransferase n=1 Tax=unclassified Streptomyces TaxID=2593676 RepID=UPI00081DED0F|nr:glycosyltransferase [Streptomyces sp. LcepLS]SCE81026.1 Glycosyl transferase family 2 [Streptomyces sp. LcepLS]
MSIRPPDGGRPGTPGEYGPFGPPASYGTPVAHGTPVPDGAPVPYGSPALYVPRAARELAALAVVVPAHDEEALLPHALAALRRAARHPALPVRARVRVVVVADACADATAALARAAGAHVVQVDARNPGRARAAGTAAALGLFDEPPERVWLASTDADSLVPANWLARQWRWGARGWDAVVGTVRPLGGDPALAGLLHREAALYRAAGGARHPHVHGANLGVRADAYLGVGGFPPLATGEDRALVHALESGGHRVLRTRRSPVGTSARLHPRASGGYGARLARLALHAAVEETEPVRGAGPV